MLWHDCWGKHEAVEDTKLRQMDKGWQGVEERSGEACARGLQRRHMLTPLLLPAAGAAAGAAGAAPLRLTTYRRSSEAGSWQRSAKRKEEQYEPT